MGRLRHPPERQIDPAALRQEGRGAGDDAVDAVEGETALALKRHGVARGEAEGAGRRVALKPADAEQRRVAERQRDDRRGEAPPRRGPGAGPSARARVVEVDEAGLGRRRAGRDRREGGEKPRRHRRPRAAGLRMRRLVAIAALVRDPAERAAIAHHEPKTACRCAACAGGRAARLRGSPAPRRAALLERRGRENRGNDRPPARSATAAGGAAIPTPSGSPSLGAGRGV